MDWAFRNHIYIFQQFKRENMRRCLHVDFEVLLSAPNVVSYQSRMLLKFFTPWFIVALKGYGFAFDLVLPLIYCHACVM